MPAVLQRLLLAAACLVLAACGAAQPAPAPSQMEHIRVAYVQPSSNQAPAWMAKEAEIFPKYGLDAELTYIQGSATAVSAMLGGSLDVAQMGGPSPVAAVKQGGDLAIFAGFFNTADFRLMADPSVKSIADLKGKTVAISNFESADNFMLTKVLNQNGLKPGSDVQVIAAKDPAGQMAALKSKQVQAILLGLPSYFEAARQGAIELLNVTALKLPYQSVGLVASRPYLKSHRAVALRFLKAEIDGMRRFKSDPDFAQSVLAKYLKTTDDLEIVKKAWEVNASTVAEPPYPTLAGIQEILDNTGGAAGHQPEDFVDMSLVKELEDSGFFRKS